MEWHTVATCTLCESMLWASIFQTLCGKRVKSTELSFCLVSLLCSVIPLIRELRKYFAKQLNLWLMKNVKNKTVPVLSLKLFLSKSKLYLKKSSKTRKMKNYMCVPVQYLIKIFIEKPGCNSMKTKACLSQTTMKPILKPCLRKWIVSCKAEEILWVLDNCLMLILYIGTLLLISVVQEFKFCLMIFHDGKAEMYWPPYWEESHMVFSCYQKCNLQIGKIFL